MRGHILDLLGKSVSVVAFASATNLTPYLLLEGLKLRCKLSEERIVGVLLDHVMHETHGEYKLLGVFILFKSK